MRESPWPCVPPKWIKTLPLWGQRFGAAAELPLGAELYVLAGSAGDLVAGVRTSRVFNGVPMALRATEMDEDAGAGKPKPVAPAILSPVFFNGANSTAALERSTR